MSLAYLVTIVIFILLFLSIFMKPQNMKMKYEKLSSFECGFDPSHKMRTPFSLRFFIVTVIFLIFDIEVTIMMPIPFGANLTQFFSYMSSNFILMFLLIGGLFFEWSQGALEWS
uniref:NADH-ubiquinone oxidoreductase chain 3 n=1 Tax=Hypsibius dujardini TaxID=232323 RepID=E7BBB1_HYPDU|nr:NADH dehydrogenase subunit 3 [Hypsibius dujardini]CBY83892.1 NADH dehydogenase subunit 3 [Hypsibius dujardini]